MVHDVVFLFIKIFNKIPFVRSILRSIYTIKDSKLKRKILGIDFPNPIGLAAGFDKDAKLFNYFAKFLRHLEIHQLLHREDFYIKRNFD